MANEPQGCRTRYLVHFWSCRLEIDFILVRSSWMANLFDSNWRRSTMSSSTEVQRIFGGVWRRNSPFPFLYPHIAAYMTIYELVVSIYKRHHNKTKRVRRLWLRVHWCMKCHQTGLPRSLVASGTSPSKRAASMEYRKAARYVNFARRAVKTALDVSALRCLHLLAGTLHIGASQFPP